MHMSDNTYVQCSEVIDEEGVVSNEGAHLSPLHWLPGLLDCSDLLGGCWLDLQALPQQVVLAALLVPSPQAASSPVQAAQGCLQPEDMLSHCNEYLSLQGSICSSTWT